MPSLSVALAAMVTVAGRVTLLLSAGVMMLMLGGMLGAAAVTVMWREPVLARVKQSCWKLRVWLGRI